jgi:hypothetical protein
MAFSLPPYLSLDPARSFALTMSIVISSLIGVPVFVALYLLLGTSDEQARRAARGLVELDPRGRAGRALPAARGGRSTADRPRARLPRPVVDLAAGERARSRGIFYFKRDVRAGATGA